MNPSDSFSTDTFNSSQHGSPAGGFTSEQTGGKKYDAVGALDDEDIYLPERQRLLKRSAKELGMTEAELDLLWRAGFQGAQIPAGFSERRKLLGMIECGGERPKNWMLMSGLEEESSPRVQDERDRRKSVRALHKLTVLLIRANLKFQETDPNRAERTVFWDPTAQVCRNLEISQSRLSKYCKELTGNSFVQTIDVVRAETVRAKMKAGLREFVLGMKKTHCASFATDSSIGELDKWAVWKELKKSRRWPEFSRDIWANELGFASYRRMYRACVSVFRKTPLQMELELIAELLATGEEILNEGEVGVKEQTLAEIEREIGALKPFSRMEGWGKDREEVGRE